jgi:hypothetical protein
VIGRNIVKGRNGAEPCLCEHRAQWRCRCITARTADATSSYAQRKLRQHDREHKRTCLSWRCAHLSVQQSLCGHVCE